MNANLPIRSGLPEAGTPRGGARMNPRTLLLVATLITLGLKWAVPYSEYALYPLRLFVTFVHESGHALAALASGGSVVSLTVRPDTSGVTMTMTPVWAQWLVFSGGYLGAALFGALLLQIGRLSRWQNAGRMTLYALGGFVLLATLLWAHNPLTNLFTLVVGLLLSAGLFLLARFTSPGGANFVAAFLAVQCSLNAFFDLQTLFTLTTRNLGDNDAVFMARAYPFLPPTFWATLWGVLAVVMTFASLRSYWRATTPKTGGAGAIRA